MSSAFYYRAQKFQMSSGARQGMLMSEDTEGEKGQWALGCPWTPKAFE